MSQPISKAKLEDDASRWAQPPGVEMPARRRRVDRSGLSIAVYEWGSEAAPPLLMVHGGFDFAMTFARFAPLLAAAGWRVVCWDQRGHGDSDHACLYSWDADLRDLLAVLDSVTREPVPLLGHSKGGLLATQFAQALPHRVSHLVNIDGLPSRRRSPDVSDRERSRLLDRELAGWLDHRRAASERIRRPGTIEELAERRSRMNPRFDHAWLCYLVTQGARRDDDGWRWKIDPAMRFGGFGPWNPEWELQRLPGLTVPLLGMLAEINEMMRWATSRADLEPWLPAGARLVSFPDAGHFIHIEEPDTVARAVLDFLGPPGEERCA